jgi:hypothetical protein
MPKVSSDRPPGLRPFHHLGVDLRPGVGSDQSVGDCPFCGREEKFYVHMDTGMWDCKVCDAQGNPVEWLRRLWEASGFHEQRAALLAAERRLTSPQTLETWGVRWNTLTEEWLVPFFNSQGLLSQLCRYAMKGGRTMLLPTPGKELGIHDGMAAPIESEGLAEAADTIYLCEKPWDAMCLWEAMKDTDQHEAVSVLSLRTASTWHESYAPLFAGKKVVVMFDNDHPRLDPNGRQVAGGGHQGLKKVSVSLAGLSPPNGPSEVCHLHWGEDGHDPSLPSGYDLRDWIPLDSVNDGRYTDDPDERAHNLAAVLSRVKPVPASWLEDGKIQAAAKKGQLQIKPRKCESWQELRAAFEGALYWTEGLDRTLSVILAASMSVDMPGDQVWVRVISPPSGGKTTLLEAVCVTRKYAHAESNIRSFFSGYQSDREGTLDLSLASKANGKVLVTKDLGPILDSPYREKVMGEARDLYDGSATSPFLNKMKRSYQNHRMVWLMGGTDAVASMDSSELGERSLTVRVMDRIDERMEDEIGRQAIREVIANRGQSASSGQGHHAPRLRDAYALTGGYVEYLCANASRLLGRINPSEEVIDQIHVLGKFVAHMRARPPRKHEERSGREMSTRLRKQLAKLTLCLPVVMQKKEIDGEVMGRIWHVAMDTSRGRSLQVVRVLRKAGRRGGMLLEELNEIVKHLKPDKLYDLMCFLDDEGVIERYQPTLNPGVRGRPRWRITSKMLELYDRVMGLKPSEE